MSLPTFATLKLPPSVAAVNVPLVATANRPASKLATDVPPMIFQEYPCSALKPAGAPYRLIVKRPLALAVIAPVAVSRSQVVPAVPVKAVRSTRILPPGFSASVPQVRLVATAVALVGSTVPPVIARLPTRLELFSVAFVATVTAEFDSEPLTTSVLAPVTTVAPLRGLWPDSVSVPARFVSAPAPLMMPA